MSKKFITSKSKASGIGKIGLTVEGFVKVLDNYFGSVFVADGNGIILFFNEPYYTNIGLSRKEHLGRHVSYLVKQGIFDRSLTLEVLDKKQVVTGTVKDKFGKELFIRAVPVFDDHGEIVLVVQFAQGKMIIGEFLKEIDKSKKQIEDFYSTLEFIKSFGTGLDFIYKSNIMAQIVAFAKIVAKTDGPILLTGESGTGKEVIARYIHEVSDRSKEIFLPVNCAAIPGELMESELFGFTGGSFTGARKEGKPGLFELANKGTLFLDEIGDLPLLLQSKLLRVLETGEFTRLGGTISIKTDARIIYSTNRDLNAMIKEKSFRRDLFHRLNVLPINIPPLRERIEDIEILANYFLDIYNKKYRQSKWIPEPFMKKIQAYKWPGNVRELKNVIQRFVITDQREILTQGTNIIDNELLISAPLQNDELPVIGELKKAVSNYEKRYISAALTICNSNVTKAAQLLGVHRSVIYKKLRN